MDKNMIKKRLKLLQEEGKPTGLSKTEKVQTTTKSTNKQYYKEVGDKMQKYTDGAKTDEKKNTEATKKREYTNDEKEYHDDYETLNGLEMNRYDNPPNEEFTKRAIKAIEGDSSMGNGPGANAEATWGASSDTFGKDLVKRIKGRNEKEIKATPTITQFGDDIEMTDGKPRIANRKLSVSENKTELKTDKMKRLKFKKPFNGVGNALQLIPETYKIDGKTFQMTDGNENYEIRWEGKVNEGKAIVLIASDKNMVNEDMNHMKHLMGYKSQETLGNLKGKERITENDSFTDIFNKTKKLLNEGNDNKNIITETTGVAAMGFKSDDVNETEEIEGQTAPIVKDDKTPYAKAEGDMVMNEDEECEVDDLQEALDRFDEIFKGL